MVFVLFHNREAMVASTSLLYSWIEASPAALAALIVCIYNVNLFIPSYYLTNLPTYYIPQTSGY